MLSRQIAEKPDQLDYGSESDYESVIKDFGVVRNSVLLGRTPVLPV